MNDLISRTDAIEAWNKLSKRGRTEFDQVLMTLPSIEDEWIPVSKRLPDIDVPVLVSDGVYVWEDELQKDYEDGKIVYWWDSQCSFDFNNTAWQLKPKPYRGGGDE